MIVFVMLSVVSGMLAGGFALMTGFSFLAAILLYSLAGCLTLALFIARAYVCQKIQEWTGEFNRLEDRAAAAR